MPITVSITLSKVQAEALLRSDGFSAGWGVRKSHALNQGEQRILDAVQTAYNEEYAK